MFISLYLSLPEYKDVPPVAVFICQNVTHLVSHFIFCTNCLITNFGPYSKLHIKTTSNRWWLRNSLVTGSQPFHNDDEGLKICIVTTLIVVENSKAWSGWHGHNRITRNISIIWSWWLHRIFVRKHPLQIKRLRLFQRYRPSISRSNPCSPFSVQYSNLSDVGLDVKTQDMGNLWSYQQQQVKVVIDLKEYESVTK